MKPAPLIAALAAVVVVAVLVLIGRDDAPSSVEDVPLPTSIAAIGDSITAGVGAAPGAFKFAPEHAWATGDAEDDVASHYERLLAAQPAIQGRNYNFAVSGATMADAPAQARDAVASGAAYVTILLGANDVCAPSVETMTPVAQFERDFREALETLARGLPDAHFFVVSIPDVHRLWEVFRDHPIAMRVWGSGATCGAMLDPGNTDAERRLAHERNIAYNLVLERVCAEQQRCRYDDGAVFEYEFDEDLVAIDFFHPSHLGHSVLADLTWEHSYWPQL